MKNKNLGYITFGVLFILISVIVFVIPTEKTKAFFIAYIFTIIAFLAQIIIWKRTIGKEDTLKSKFLGIPIMHVGIMYLTLQIIVLAIFTGAHKLPVWSAIIICALIICISTLCMIAVDTGREAIECVDSKVEKKVSFIKDLQADVELLTDKELDTETKVALQKLAENIRFSDPMSDESLKEIEKKIYDEVIELKTSTDKMTIIQELNSLISERNKKCLLRK